MVHSFPEEGLLPTTLKDLTVAFFGNLQALNGKGFRHLASFRRLVITDCYKLQSLPAEGLPRTLTSLVINECPWLRARCQRGTGEEWPKIQHIPQIQIDRKEI
ncbi:LRR domain containing protein [Trema orientale]|uniref:LRR domain containing protein n=1 Tax=Trema orientale TaxID=63057 RepID=A0A2P5EL58_TREOI|nr:LRR domain containing protein [Trema orientale]